MRTISPPNVDEQERWQEARDRAARLADFEEQRAGADCARNPRPFQLSEESYAWARLATEICEGCPIREDCLEVTLHEEIGLRPSQRFGVIAALTGRQRYAMTKKRGCGVCGKKLGGPSLYCGEHQVRGARQHALDRAAS